MPFKDNDNSVWLHKLLSNITLMEYVEWWRIYLLEYSYTMCTNTYMRECIRIRRSVALKYSASESNWTETMNGSLCRQQHFALCSGLHFVQQLSNSDCPGNSLYMNFIFRKKQILNWSMNFCRPLINKYFNPTISHIKKNKGRTQYKIALHFTPKIHNVCCPDAPMLNTSQVTIRFFFFSVGPGS
jgi:hypothetical protein